MLKRFIRDESGIAMGLAVVMIVLIGVMGAGLLVFVRNDLEAVVEVNNGQKALDIADSGMQVARQQILGNKVPARYDVDSISPLFYAANCNVASESANSEWSPEPRPDVPDGGVTRSFAGGQFHVTVRWMNQDSLTDGRCIAPETSSSPSPSVDYFKVVSTGTYGDAKRKVETIYSTYDLNVPKGYFTPNAIDVRGSAKVSGVSLFSLSNINVGNGAEITGTDQAYSDWQNSINPTARRDAGGNPITTAGLGAAGTITNGKVAGRGYDKDTCPKLVRDLSESSPCPSPDKITFPFSPNRQPDINVLRQEAMRQEQEDPLAQRHYYTPSIGNFSLDDWPDSSTESTVVFVEYSGASSNLVKWNVSGSCTDNPPKKGTLVIRNGNFTTQPNTARFQGVVVVREGEALDETADGASTDTAKTCLEGFVNASGDIKIAGNATPVAPNALEDRPGFYGVQQWSWRELYQ